MKRFGSALMFLVAGAFAFSFGEETPSSVLSSAIDRAVSKNDEVVAWENAIETLDRTDVRRSLDTELRLRAERDYSDEEQRIQGALRWKLDGDEPRWLLLNKKEQTLLIYKSELSILRNKLRSGIKKKLINLAYLRSKLEVAREEELLYAAVLAEGEELLNAGESNRLNYIKRKLRAVSAREEVLDVENDVRRLEASLWADYSVRLPHNQESSIAILGLSEGLRNPQEIEAGSFLDEVLRDHPLTSIFQSEARMANDRLVHEKGKDKLGLSYLQLQYEENNDLDSDANESVVGVGLGVKLPSWKQRSGEKAGVRFAESQVSRLGRVGQVREDLTRSISEWRTCSERQLRYGRELRELESELRDLERLMDQGEQSSSLFELRKERFALARELLELDRDGLLAAIEFEAVSCREMVGFYGF